MKWSNYSTLKSASKVGFEKVAEESKDGVVLKPAHIVLSKKQFDVETGEALSDSKREIGLKELKYEKARYDDIMAKAKAESDELAKAIEDFKKL